MTNSVETWLPIPGYEGSYEVSSIGNVRSLPRTVKRSDGWAMKVKGRMLKIRPWGAGYNCVDLWKGNRGHVENVHVLVAAAFLGPRPDGMVVCHYNDVKTDNRVENLRYASRVDNEADKRRNGLDPKQRQTKGTRCGHLLVEPNLVQSKLKHGVRQCLACARAQSHCYYRGIENWDERKKVSDQYYDSIMKGVAA